MISKNSVYNRAFEKYGRNDNCAIVEYIAGIPSCSFHINARACFFQISFQATRDMHIARRIYIKRVIPLFPCLMRISRTMQFHYGRRVCILLYPESPYHSIKALCIPISKVWRYVNVTGHRVNISHDNNLSQFNLSINNSVCILFVLVYL